MPSIALVRSSYRSDGGAERFMQRLVQALAQQATLQTTLITRQWQQASTGGPGIHASPAGNPTIVELSMNSHRWQSRREKSLAFDHAVSQYLATHPFDLVQMHERIPGGDIYRAGDGLHVAWLAERSRIDSRLRQWWTTHDSFHRLQLAREKAMLTHPRLKAIVCISRMVQQDIQRYYPAKLGKTQVIYNGVDTTQFTPCNATEREHQRTSQGLSADKFTLLFCGSGWLRKGLGTVLQSVAACKAVQQIQLIVIGQDKHRRRYEKLACRLGIGAQVKFAGVQAQPLIFYQMADLFFLPSLYEPFSNAALEALACGCPIVVSSRCGVAELVQEGENGFVCDSLDTPSYAAIIDELARNALRRTNMRDKARATALQFTLQKSAAEYAALYQKLLATQGSAPHA